MQLRHQKRLSCGVIVLNPQHELLLCHVTGQHHWDLPKGGIDSGESPRQAALRETREETGLRLDADALLDLGPFPYTTKKNLHLFACLIARIDLGKLRCESHYADRFTGRMLPEMDDYGWCAFERLHTLCTPKMAAVLGRQIDLAAVLRRLSAAPRAVLAGAAEAQGG